MDRVIQPSRLSKRGLSRRRMCIAGLSALGVAFLACGRIGARSNSPVLQGSAGGPRNGGVLRHALTTSPRTLDPLSQDAGGGTVLTFTNDSLLQFKAGPGVAYSEITVQPHLAMSWETPDPMTYVLHLQPGVSFANMPPVNGRALTSADVQWTYEYLSQTGAFKSATPSMTATMFSGLSAIETPDETTVRIRLAKPSAPFLNYIGSTFTSILAHEIYEQAGSFAKRTVGTGPWQFDTSATQKDTRWNFRKNPGYFQAGQPYLEEVDSLIIPDVSTQVAAFQARQIDVVDYQGLSLDAMQQIKKSLPDAVISAPLDKRAMHFGMNQTKPPFSDPRVRQALSLSMDRDEFIRLFADGKGEWAFAASLPGLFSEAEVKKVYSYSPAQARQLLQAAGYANGVDVDFPYQNGYGSVFSSVLQLAQAQAKRTGFNLVLKPTETAAIQELRRADQLILDVNPSSGPGSSQLDIDDALYGKAYPGSGSNYSQIDDPKLTAMLDAERQEMDPAMRRQLVRGAIEYANSTWFFGLFFAPRYMAWSNRIRNYGGPSMTINEPGYVAQSWLG
jgi:peptide/nickel transport system substrate-binding protein